MKKEITWKRIKGFDEYRISSIGDVYSLKSNKVLRQQLSHNGYLRVCLYDKNYKQHTEIAHRLVGFNFLKSINGKNQINHKNGIKTDNNVENLEWVTSKENITHSWKNGLAKSLKGEKHPLNKLTDIEVLEIRKENNKGVKQRDLARRFNVGFQNIHLICRGKTWKHLTT